MTNGVVAIAINKIKQIWVQNGSPSDIILYMHTHSSNNIRVKIEFLGQAA